MSFQYPVKNLVLSHSGRSSFRRCARLLEFGKLYGDSDDRDEMFAAECGKALHVGFQSFLVDRSEEWAIFKFLIAYPHELEFNKPENSSRSLEACFITLMELIHSPLVDRYELIHIKTRFGTEKPAIEVPFAIGITGAPLPVPVWFVGFIDAILYDKFDDRYLVSDIKTTRMRIADYSARYEFDEQCVPYGIILEHILQKKIDEFKISYLSAYIDILEPKVAMYSFNKTQDHIHDWYRGLCEDIGRVGKYYKNQWFPRATNGETCFSFNKPCWFNDYCSHRDPEIIQRMVGGNIREGLFHDDQQPWIVAELPWMEV
jgi:hypothetical protein